MLEIYTQSIKNKKYIIENLLFFFFISFFYFTYFYLIGGSSDELYTMMAQNLFGQVADFWLEGKQFTKLQSQVMPKFQKNL